MPHETETVPHQTETIQREVQSMMGGTETPEQAAANMQAKYDDMVAQGYKYGK